MTNREYYLNVLDLIDVIESDDPTGCVDTKLMAEKTHELLSKLDTTNEKRRSADSKEKKEAAARREAVLAFINEQTEPVTRDTIAGCLDMSPSQASAACKSLIESGAVQKSEVKVDKKSKVAYSKA